MTTEQIEAAILEEMHTQAALVVTLDGDDEDYTYQPLETATIRREELAQLQARIFSLEAECVMWCKNLGDAQSDVAAEIQRAETAETQLAEMQEANKRMTAELCAVGDYGAAQWHRGFAGKGLQEFDEWQAQP